MTELVMEDEKGSGRTKEGKKVAKTKGRTITKRERSGVKGMMMMMMEDENENRRRKEKEKSRKYRQGSEVDCKG